MTLSTLLQRLPSFASFLRRSDGNSTIEVVLWVPFFVLTVMASGQLALVFFGQAMTLDAAQNATRAYSIGTLTSEAEVRAQIQAELSNVSNNVAVVSVKSNDLITTVVTVPASDFGGPLRFITQFSSLNVQVVAQQFTEV